MPYPAGGKVRASTLNGPYQTAAGTCSSTLTLTTTPTDVPGCSVTVSVVGASAYAVVTANAEFAVSVAAAGVLLSCSLLVDGVNQAALGTVRDSAEYIHDGHRSYTWKVPLSAGSHTLKLSGSKSASGGTAAIANYAGSNIVVQVFDLP